MEQNILFVLILNVVVILGMPQNCQQQYEEVVERVCENTIKKQCDTIRVRKCSTPLRKICKTTNGQDCEMEWKEQCSDNFEPSVKEEDCSDAQIQEALEPCPKKWVTTGKNQKDWTEDPECLKAKPKCKKSSQVGVRSQPECKQVLEANCPESFEPICEENYIPEDRDCKITPQEQCYEVPFKACRNVKTKGRPIGNPNCKTNVETRLESVVKDIKNQEVVKDTKIQESVKDDNKTPSFGGAINFGS